MRSVDVLLYSLFLSLFFSLFFRAVALPAKAQIAPSKECAVSVGLVDHLKMFSHVPMPTFGECQASCRSTMAHWDNENYSTRCEWDGKVFSENKINLMDVNWASCQVAANQQIRVSRRACVRACADHLKHLPKGTSPESGHCDWDGHAVSQADLEKSRGLYP